MRKVSTLAEVAKAAGVSVITASRAIRGLGYVSEATRLRVQEAAAQLDYQPDMLAKRMRGDSGNLIGVFINNFGSVVMHELISAISQEARRLGYDLVVFHAQSFNEPGRAATSEMLRKLCEGLLLVLPNTFDHYLDKLEQDRFPCVLVNFAARKMALPVVVCQNRQGAREAVEHLLALGHRRIGFIAGTPFTGQSAERQRGYIDALGAAGVDVDPALIVEGNFNQVSGFQAAETLLALASPPTAIFAANDEMALGALDAIRTGGLNVPDDISLIGFDDIPAARYAYPALTTLSQPFTEMGVRAVKELVDIMRGKEVTAQRIEFPTPMVVRGSTGPVRTTTKHAQVKGAARKAAAEAAGRSTDGAALPDSAPAKRASGEAPASGAAGTIPAARRTASTQAATAGSAAVSGAVPEPAASAAAKAARPAASATVASVAPQAKSATAAARAARAAAPATVASVAPQAKSANAAASAARAAAPATVASVAAQAKSANAAARTARAAAPATVASVAPQAKSANATARAARAAAPATVASVAPQAKSANAAARTAKAATPAAVASASAAAEAARTATTTTAAAAPARRRGAGSGKA